MKPAENHSTFDLSQNRNFSNVAPAWASGPHSVSVVAVFGESRLNDVFPLRAGALLPFG